MIKVKNSMKYYAKKEKITKKRIKKLYLYLENTKGSVKHLEITKSQIEEFAIELSDELNYNELGIVEYDFAANKRISNVIGKANIICNKVNISNEYKYIRALEVVDIDNNVFLPHLGLGKLDVFPLSKSPIQHKNEILHKFHSNPKYKQNFALYSISGAFNILYIPSHIQIARITRTYDYHFSFLYAVCKKVRAFIIDTVNFNNDDDSDQPIGVWDYENVGFDLYNSIQQYLGDEAKFNIKGVNIDLRKPARMAFSIETKENRHILYNSHFKKSQAHFNLGCDFFLYSSAFLDMDFSDTQMQDTAIIMKK